MITRLVAGLLLAAGLVAVPGTPATAGGTVVSVADMRFTPASLTVSLGTEVTWDFPDAMVHTTTSAQGFWNSGARSGGETFTHVFDTAGTYSYQCSFHPSMRGTVRVPVAATGSAGTGWRLRWAEAAGEATFDVQVRKGTGTWKPLREDTAAPSASFHRPGTWTVRARTRLSAATSGWSPAVKVTTS